MAKHADLASPMIPLAEARRRVEAFASTIGRDVSRVRWCGGGSLFLNDDPAMTSRAMRWAIDTYGPAEEEQILRNGLFGHIDTVRGNVGRQIAEGASEIIVFQLPRVHMKSLMRFSDDVIPAFAAP